MLDDIKDLVGDTITNSFKVRLEESSNYPQSGSSSLKTRLTRVIFDVTPDLTENRTLDYKTVNPLHMPGQIFVYGSTSSRTFQISSIKLVSRNIKEASKNMRILWTLRGWTMPYFGSSTTLSERSVVARNKVASIELDYKQGNIASAQSDSLDDKDVGIELLGKPPEVLLLSAYSSSSKFNKRVRDVPTNLSNIPVVITSLSIPYNSEVDYVPTEDGQPMPRIMNIDIQLSETQSPKNLENFRLQDYRLGLLEGF